MRSTRSLIQTIGRAARNSQGRVILYADHITKSIEKALYETSRRRQIQQEYNLKYGIIPKTIDRKIHAIIELEKVGKIAAKANTQAIFANPDKFNPFKN